MGKKRKKRSGFERIGRVLDQVLHTYRQGSDMALNRIWEQWDHVVGEKIAANAQPAAFKGRLLVVNVSSSVWLHQLQFSKMGIIDRLNDTFGEKLIDDIRFKIGAL
ncbi:DUF721 domain-containing protein [Thermodesulfobacteriota bacterium]